MWESFGRVAAEAMINGIPPVVSNGGGLPDTVGALWDDEDLYARRATRAWDIAAERYSETVSRARHIGYLTSLKGVGRPFEA